MARYRKTHTRNFFPSWRFPLVDNTFRGGTWHHYESNPIITKGGAGTWDSLGLRDPRLLVDIQGYLVTESGNLVMYYSGYKSASPHYERAIGRCVSADGITWTKEATNPVLEGSVGEWDEFGVQTASPIKISGSYYMAYSGVDDDWLNWGIGIAHSVDGITWTKDATNPILEYSDFTIGGNNILTFPHVIKASNGTWYMLIGGTYAADGFAIFAASSDDGLIWTPMNGGDVILSPDPYSGKLDAADNLETPMLIEMVDSTFVMLYHGNRNSTYDKHYIRIATSPDLLVWTIYNENPILVPGDAGTWNDHRVENAFIPKEDLGTDTLRMWYSGCPGSDGEDNSAIGYATSDQRVY